MDVWSFFLAYLIYEFIKQFSFLKALLLAWISAFIMMWITVFNLQVLPLQILLYAIPLSLLEVIVAELIISKIR